MGCSDSKQQKTVQPIQLSHQQDQTHNQSDSQYLSHAQNDQNINQIQNQKQQQEQQNLRQSSSAIQSEQLAASHQALQNTSMTQNQNQQQKQQYEHQNQSQQNIVNPNSQRDVSGSQQIQKQQTKNDPKVKQQNQQQMFYDEGLFVEQAIHQSLQEHNQNRDVDQEFDKMMKEAMQQSKQDYEIDKRKQKEEETALISQIPELRQQKIQEIMNSVPTQQKQAKLQPIQGQPLPQNQLRNDKEMRTSLDQNIDLNIPQNAILTDPIGVPQAQQKLQVKSTFYKEDISANATQATGFQDQNKSNISPNQNSINAPHLMNNNYNFEVIDYKRKQQQNIIKGFTWGDDQTNSDIANNNHFQSQVFSIANQDDLIKDQLSRKDIDLDELNQLLNTPGGNVPQSKYVQPKQINQSQQNQQVKQQQQKQKYEIPQKMNYNYEQENIQNQQPEFQQQQYQKQQAQYQQPQQQLQSITTKPNIGAFQNSNKENNQNKQQNKFQVEREAFDDEQEIDFL